LSGDRYSDRYSLDRLELASNISEPSGTPPLPSGEVVYVCPVCGQVFFSPPLIFKFSSKLDHSTILCNTQKVLSFWFFCIKYWVVKLTFRSSLLRTGSLSTWPRGTSRGRRTAGAGCLTCATFATAPSLARTC